MEAVIYLLSAEPSRGIPSTLTRKLRDALEARYTPREKNAWDVVWLEERAPEAIDDRVFPEIRAVLVDRGAPTRLRRHLERRHALELVREIVPGECTDPDAWAEAIPEVETTPRVASANQVNAITRILAAAAKSGWVTPLGQGLSPAQRRKPIDAATTSLLTMDWSIAMRIGSVADALGWLCAKNDPRADSGQLAVCWHACQVSMCSDRQDRYLNYVRVRALVYALGAKRWDPRQHGPIVISDLPDHYAGHFLEGILSEFLPFGGEAPSEEAIDQFGIDDMFAHSELTRKRERAHSEAMTIKKHDARSAEQIETVVSGVSADREPPLFYFHVPRGEIARVHDELAAKFPDRLISAQDDDDLRAAIDAAIHHAAIIQSSFKGSALGRIS